MTSDHMLFAHFFGDTERISETAKAAFGMTLAEAEALLRKPCDDTTAAIARGVLGASPDPMHQTIVKEWRE